MMIIGLLDEVSPKGVFKELNGEIRKSLKAAKQESQSDTEKISGFEEQNFGVYFSYYSIFRAIS